MAATPSHPDFFDPSLFHPSLTSAIGTTVLNLRVIWGIAMAVVETDDEITDNMQDRRDICFMDGTKVVEWRVESLASLFRGDTKPASMEKFPPEYIPLFAIIEQQVIVYADIFGAPTDEEMMGVYSNLARLPDGRGHTLLHEHMWQACALALGTRPWSRAELEAVLRRLQRSCRAFRIGPGSRNYIATITQR
jgi:hypothetical protein